MAQQRSAALGSVLGAFIGDSLGSFIEFQPSVSAELLEETLRMPGGGPFHLGAGQTTDDSELAMCMMRGLIEGRGKLNLDAIAAYYGRWVATGPFDIGVTTRSAFTPLMERGSTAESCINAATSFNANSQSNGSLMRLTPLCVWAHRLPAEKAVHAARLEASMTHSNETIHHAGACYVLAACHLIRQAGDRQGAFEEAKSYAQTYGNKDIKHWFHHIENESPMAGSPKIGWAKIGFTHAFRQLVSGNSYIDAISQTLALGGDTDTNAAIVGGLIGAAVGIEGLPEEYVRKVTEFTAAAKGGRMRPEFLDQTDVVRQVEALVEMAPDASTFIKGGHEETL